VVKSESLAGPFENGKLITEKSLLEIKNQSQLTHIQIKE
jgi:hypothetical protein